MDKPPTTTNQSFEKIKKIDEDGIEYWEARELMKTLHYVKWSNFENVVEKSKIACKKSGQDVKNHFADVGKVIKAGKGAVQILQDFKLSRYACYLVAQNADSTKEVVALAQTYFAIQTRKQELYDSLSDEQKRILIRGEVSDHNKKLFQAAQNSGVKNFGSFNNAGYLGLYGLTARQIKDKKGIGNDDILDRAGATELAANLFRITQTNEKLQKRLDSGETIGQNSADRTHFMVGGKVRQTIKEIGGTVPEELPPEEHIGEIKKKVEPFKLDKPFGEAMK